MSSSAHRLRGFTLIEVLVSLALMSLIGTILIESLRLGGHTWRHVTREAANIDDITRAQAFLRQRIGTIYPPQPPTASTPASESFVGERERVEFSSSAPDSSAGTPAQYRLGLSTSGERTVEISYRDGSSERASSQASMWSSEPLLEHVSSLSIQFWEDSAGVPGHWVEHWADISKLPRLIRIDIDFPADDTRRWPPLYVEPRVDTRASCVFDVVGRRCRTGT